MLKKYIIEGHLPVFLPGLIIKNSKPISLSGNQLHFLFQKPSIKVFELDGNENKIGRLIKDGSEYKLLTAGFEKIKTVKTEELETVEEEEVIEDELEVFEEVIEDELEVSEEVIEDEEEVIEDEEEVTEEVVETVEPQKPQVKQYNNKYNNKYNKK